MKTKPDYWYKQSSVIPYRRVGDKVELLIIKTRKNKKWIFPKGIIEENLTPMESAEKEALEEAGVKGKVSSELIGKYIYKKWGGKCSVKVYSLKIDTILDVWEENFRERKWIMISKIEEFISNKKILKMVKDLEDSIIKKV